MAEPQSTAEARPILALPPTRAGRIRRLVAIIADNAGTETTDLVIPYGILKESGISDVVIVSTRPGVVKLIPALHLQPDMTTAEFDDTKAGADILVVPAIGDNKNPALIEWVREQAKKGTTIVTICEGVWIAARAGIFDGKAATTHWFAFEKMVRCFPKSQWLRNRRYVIDGNIMSTTGVTASIPASLALVEAIAGYPTAQAVAQRLGVDHWDAAYDACEFKLTANRILRVVGNTLAFWSHETVELPVEDGFDEIALALVADAWSRTYCARAITTSHAPDPVRSCRGLVLMPDGQAKVGRLIMQPQPQTATEALDQTLLEISARYGSSTADIVALQLEYPTRN
ncbi:hypothetical protein MRS44_013731 [Fusarium solani]|uniref:uncharacterized protein n=1 Tax=Fusarium solani TaxID=169388 RepID=UPI0032C47410|nr:hypothetical protein MRS44_013731 [Fusarium solani]